MSDCAQISVPAMALPAKAFAAHDIRLLCSYEDWSVQELIVSER